MALKLVISGADGRMGKAIIGLLPEYPQVNLVGALERDGHPDLGRETAFGIRLSADVEKVLSGADVLIDFTSPSATLNHLGVCRNLKKGIVIGTTGFTEPELAEIKAASAQVPVFISPNMSLGVNLLFRLVSEVAKNLPGYQVEVMETHHDQKVDAPSGTAKKLAEIVAAAHGDDLAAVAVYGRQGRPGPRKPAEIGIHALRLGDVVGEHVVIFADAGERIELTHKAGSRNPLASGAIKAALFLSKQKPGLYSMADLIQ
ncbi:MAG: 4-hydroxy-tetrahydrodipicolinate reductase [Candidatus Ratteibacteria bacterium]|jgi:4-hydroxy-tetrahydrodipicolinate reductase